MKYNYRALDRSLPRHVPFHQSSALSYCADQPIPVSPGYLGPDFGHSRGNFQNQMDLRETIRRQVEKERIREEIISQEIARRRILEAEVRMELMREREAAMRRGQLPEERSLEERIVRQIEERLGVGGISSTGMAARGENGRSQLAPSREWSIESWTSEVPFNQPSVEPRLFELKPHSEFQNLEPNSSEVKPVPELSKEKERIVFKAKPDGNVSGVKRKAEAPLEAAVSSEVPRRGVPKKKVKEEWSCALCKVSATSQDGLNEHLRGKKHKANEAGLKAQQNAKKFSIGLFPKKPKPVELVETTDNDVKSKESSFGLNGNDASSLKIDRVVDDSKEKNVVLVQNKRKTKDKKRKKYKFWCEDCKVGAFSEKVMEDHKIGKKHLARFQGMKGEGTAAMPSEKLNDDDEGTKQNRHKIGASSEDAMKGHHHMMSKEHSSPPREMKAVTQLNIATEIAIVTQKGPEASSGSAIQAVDAID